MIILHIMNGEKVEIPGETYEDFLKAFPMGKLTLTFGDGTSIVLMRERVAFPQFVPDALIKKQREERELAKAKREADEQAAYLLKEEKAEAARVEKLRQDQAEYMRRHRVKTFLGSLRKRWGRKAGK
jgi:hypothetical protein